MLRKLLYSFLFVFPFAINAQTLDDGNYFFKQYGELLGERKELLRVVRNLNSTEYELGKDLYVEYDTFAMRIESLYGYIYLYSLLPPKEKKIANAQFMKTTFKFYLEKSDSTLEVISLIQATTKSPFLNQSAENLKIKVKMSRSKVEELIPK